MTESTAFAIVDVYGDNEYAVVREPNGTYAVAVRSYVDPDVVAWDFTYVLTADWPTSPEAFAWVCGYARGLDDNR